MSEIISPDSYLHQIQANESTHRLDASKESIVWYFKEKRPDIWAWFKSLPKEEIDRRIDNLVSKVVGQYGPMDSILREMKSKFLTACSLNERQKLADITVGSLYTFDPNGRVIQSPSGDPVVVIHVGIMHLSYYASRFLASMFDVDSQGVIRTKPAVKDYVKSQSRKLLNCCISLITDGQIVPEDTYTVLSRGQILLAALYLKSTEMFILGHEFGHIQLGHLGELNTSNRFEDVQYFINRSYVEEYEADEWSHARLLSTKEKKGTGEEPHQWTIVGGIMALSELLILEKTIELFPTINRKYFDGQLTLYMSESTHPPTYQRRDRLLRNMVNSISKSDYNEVDLIASAFDEAAQLFEEICNK